MKNFIKQNLALVLGISLPVLLTIFFMLARTIPEYTVEDPAYDVIFADNFYSDYSIIVKNQKAYLKVTPQTYDDPPEPNIYRYNSLTGQTRKIDITIPDEAKEFAEQTRSINLKNMNINVPVDPNNLPTQEQAQNAAKIASDLNKMNKLQAPQEYLINELKDIKLDGAITSPDGYLFRHTTSNNKSGLIFSFGPSYANLEPTLSKQSRHIPIKIYNNTTYSYNGVHFIGWVIP